MSKRSYQFALTFFAATILFFSTGCDGIKFHLSTFYGLTMHSDIQSKGKRAKLINIFDEHGIHLQKYGSNNPQTYSYYSESEVSQIVVIVWDTGFISSSISERRFGVKDEELCFELKKYQSAINSVITEFGAKLGGENENNYLAIKRCKIGF